MSSSNDYYDILGVRPTAKLSEIELAFRGRRTQYHPDKYANADADTVRWATEKMQEVNEAYQILSDENRRRSYETQYQSQRQGSHANGSASQSRQHDHQSRQQHTSQQDRKQSRPASGMGSRIAEIQRQLSRDFDRTLRSFLENAGSDEDKDFLDAMLFTLRRATDLVSSNLHQFSLADDDEKMATSIGRTQYLVVILSIHSLSNTPPYIITNMGREVYFQIQGLSLLQFERVTKEFADRGSKFHQQMLESKVMEIMGAILSVPQDEKLEINLKMPRKEFLPRLLQDNPLYLDAAIANKFKQQAEDVNRQWLVKLEEVENAGMAEEAASASSREKSHPCSHASSTSNRNILDQEPRILNYLSRLALQDKDAKRFHFAHDIPQKKLSNALACRSYYATKPPNQAYLLVDNTVFEGGSDGLLITDEVISFKEMFVSSIDYAYTKGGNGNFAVQGATIRRHDQVCIRFSQISASAVQMLVWALNQFFADRFDWHVEMALRGHVESQFILSASCHDKPGEELRWLTLAAENGHVNAQHNLGMHYFYKNPPLAFQWFTKAAQQGSTNAERNLLSDVFKQFH